MEKVGERTPLCPLETGCLSKSRTAGSQFARDLITIQQSIVDDEVENVGRRTPSDPMETGCRGRSPSDCRESVRET